MSTPQTKPKTNGNTTTWDWRSTGRRFLFELGPALVFLAAVKIWDIYVGTIVLFCTTLISTTLSWYRERRVPVVPMAGLALTLAFGGLTLMFEDPGWIKMRPTVLNLAGAVVLLGALGLNRLLLRDIFGAGVTAPDALWRRVTLALIAFLIALAVINEAIWRTSSTEAWATFKAIGIPTLDALFIGGAGWLLTRASAAEPEPEAMGDPAE